MTTPPLVSIIMNCYNGEKYLQESLQSVFTQTYENWELIFWDNLSSDSSKKILKTSMTEELSIFALNVFKFIRGQKSCTKTSIRKICVFFGCR